MRELTAPVPRWDASDAGHPERFWVRQLPWGAMPRVDIPAIAQQFDTVTIMAAHPDDETLALAGTIHQLVRAGARVHIVSATDGEASHPQARTVDQQTMAAVRRQELADAARVLGCPEPVTTWGLPDGKLADHRNEMRTRLAQLSAQTGRTLLLAPWLRDGHADHDALGASCAEYAAEQPDVEVAFYPVWMWHWADDIAQEQLRGSSLIALDADALHAKRAAVARYTSQHSCFDLPEGVPAVLTSSVLQRCDRVVEVLLTTGEPDLPHHTRAAATSTSAAQFDAMFEHSDDPWHVEDSWYEARRRDLILAMLPQQHCGRVLDVGCSTGRLTQELAPRAERVVAVDQSGAALQRAQQRPLRNVTWVQARLPGQWQEMLAAAQKTPFDLVLISEVGYFLDGSDLMELAARVDDVLAPGGHVLIANWQRPTTDIPLNGPLVDAQFDRIWWTQARYRDDDCAITLFRREAPDA